MAVPEEIQRQVLEEATSAKPNYSVDMNDERFAQVNEDIDNTWNEYYQTVGGMADDADKYYKDLANQSQQWADKQAQIQQENTDFAIEKIEQQKEQAQKDYIKEQSGAYADWQKQSNAYGVNAEKMAAQGLTNTGFSESSQVSMYNTYQNRVATAREAFSQAKMNYDNNIKEAMLQNNAALAEIYANAYKEQLTLALEGFQYKNQLVLNIADKKMELDNTKWNRYMDVYQQINTENQLAWDVESYYDNKAWQTEQKDLDREFTAKEAELDRKFQADQAEIERKFKEAQAELDRKHDEKMLKAKTAAEKEILEKQHKNDMKKLEKQQEYEMAQLDKELANDKKLLAYENSLNSSPIAGDSSDGNSGRLNLVADGNHKKIANTNAVNTAYYSGSLNSDAKKYGTFSNGYQPKGISGHGKLSKTGKTTNVATTIQYGGSKGQKVTVKQNIWKAEDGTKWIWDGRNNKYVPA